MKPNFVKFADNNMSDDERMDVDEAVEDAGQNEAGTSKAKGSKSGKRFEIKKWNAVAMWSWAICTDTCAICRNNLYEPSIEYQVRHNWGFAVFLGSPLCFPAAYCDAAVKS
jgi:hypothetical protein